MTKLEMALFDLAERVSKESDHPRHKLGAVIYDKHRVVSTGCNSNTKTHRVQAEIDFARHGEVCPGKIHAEISALIPLINEKRDLSSAKIFVFRQHKNGTPAMAKPCPGCMKLIRECNIKKIYYSIENGFAEEYLK